MNEEYLWDKTGSDIEIENLEDAFSSLRYRPCPPPKLQPEKAAKRGWMTSWLTPTAGLLSAALMLLAVGAGWQIAKPGSSSDQAARSVAVVRNETGQPARIDERPAAMATKPDKVISATTALHVPESRATRSTLASATTRKPKKLNVKRRNDPITPEELKAYEQVMLALSIASDKLKIVSEAARGTDD